MMSRVSPVSCHIQQSGRFARKDRPSSYPDIHQMSDRRYSLLLHHRGGAEQRACRDEQDIAVAPRAQAAQYMPAQHRGTAPAARASGVDVLSLAEYHHAAVPVVRRQVYALLQQQIIQQPRAHPPQIACEDAVIVPRIGIGRAQEAIYGVRRSRC